MSFLLHPAGDTKKVDQLCFSGCFFVVFVVWIFIYVFSPILVNLYFGGA